MGMSELDFLRGALDAANQSGKSVLVDDYERALGEWFGSRHAIAVNSGSAAIQVALHSLGAKRGRRVAVSAMAPLPSLLPILATGATPLFVDSRPTNPGMDPLDLERSLSPNVAAAMEVPLWGYPGDYQEISEILAAAAVPLVEDAAQAHGSRIGARCVGTFAAAGCFSTHHQKFLSTGEGGFILTDDDDLYARMKSYARLGHLGGASEGMNFKISAFTASIGLARLSQLEERVRSRRAVALDLLERLPYALSTEMDHVGTPNGYNLVVANNWPSNFQQALADQGIDTDAAKYGYKLGFEHALFAELRRPCSNAAALIDRLVQLPTSPDALEDTLTRVGRAWTASAGSSPSTSMES
jgi:perosamine synthetase